MNYLLPIFAGIAAALVGSCGTPQTHSPAPASAPPPVAEPAARESTVTIEFSANRTTGYSWSYTLHPGGIVQETSRDYQVSPGPDGAAPLPGQGGIALFTFAGIGPGEAVAQWVYTRPWETGVPPVRTAVTRFTVDSAGHITAATTEE